MGAPAAFLHDMLLALLCAAQRPAEEATGEAGLCLTAGRDGCGLLRGAEGLSRAAGSCRAVGEQPGRVLKVQARRAEANGKKQSELAIWAERLSASSLVLLDSRLSSTRTSVPCSCTVCLTTSYKIDFCLLLFSRSDYTPPVVSSSLHRSSSRAHPSFSHRITPLSFPHNGARS